MFPTVTLLRIWNIIFLSAQPFSREFANILIDTKSHQINIGFPVNVWLSFLNASDSA
jgi:hypothetical protein